MEIPASQLYDIYMRLKNRQAGNPPPITLENIWEALVNSKYLRDLGATVSTKHLVIRLPGLEGIADNAIITADRDLYEKGASDIADPVHFASYGNPVFDQIVKEFQRFDLPGCVARITEEVPDVDTAIAAYAAACINNTGQPEIKLITGYSDLHDLVLDEEKTLGEFELSTVKQTFHEIVRSEFDPTRSIDRLVQDNEKAGVAHALLNLLVADSLFPGFNSTEEENFWQAVKNWDEINADRDRFVVPNIPTEPLAKIKKYMLFDLYVSQAGDRTTLTLPIIIVKSAVNTACRVADSLRERKAGLTIGRVKARIKREMEKYSDYNGFGGTCL
jgi:hypothetical protein